MEPQERLTPEGRQRLSAWRAARMEAPPQHMPVQNIGFFLDKRHVLNVNIARGMELLEERQSRWHRHKISSLPGGGDVHQYVAMFGKEKKDALLAAFRACRIEPAAIRAKTNGNLAVTLGEESYHHLCDVLDMQSRSR